jgi:hypothetical protein
MAGCEQPLVPTSRCYASSAMERSSGELLPSDKPRQHRTDQIVVGALSRAGNWLAVARGSDRPRTPAVVDAALGSGTMAVYAVGTVVQVGWRVSAPLRQLIARPPLVPVRYQPASFVDAVVRLGEQYRLVAELAADAVATTLVKQVIDGVLDQIDLTSLVLERVDLDRVVTAVDIGAVIKRLDLTEIVLEEVDLDRVIETVDIEAVIKRLDLTEIVLEDVDLERVVAAVDIDAIIHRLDLVTLTTYVIDEIDLPEIIRQSTGSVANEAVRGVRMQSVEADQAIQRTVDRLLLRRKARSTGGAVPPTNGTEQ